MKNTIRRLFKRNTPPKQKLKYKLSIAQHQEKVVFTGEFSQDYYCARELWLLPRNPEAAMLRVGEMEPSQAFRFEVDLPSVLAQIGQNEEPAVYDCYLKVQAVVSELSEKTQETLEERAEIITVDGVEMAEYLVRFGRFQHTDMDPQTPVYNGDSSGVFYLSTKGNLSFLVNGSPKPSIKLQIDSFKTKNDKIVLEGKLFTKNSQIVSGRGFIRGRETKTEFPAAASFERKAEETRTKFGLNRYMYRLELDLGQLSHADLADEVYDFFFSFDLHDQEEEVLHRIGRPTTRVKLFYKETRVRRGDNVAVINPYFTFKKANLSLEVYQFPHDSYELMRKMIRWAPLLRPFKKKDIWLVGERMYKAQDTGYHFFKYMREQHPERDVYYVIDKNSPEARNVEPLGNVLYFKTKEHIEKTIFSSRIISSHHPDYLYPVRTKRFKKRVKAIKIFLQHGVMGTKNMVANYGKNAASGFNTHLFLVSSDFEKEMIIDDFGYQEDEVFVTGLSRFDSLMAQDVSKKRQLLIIPTWRDWITSDEVFFESEYFERYRDLIHNPVLHRLAEQNGFEIVFCLHPNMQRFTPYFKDAPVKVISQGEVDVQQLIKESAMMITDYSSVAFDFSFLHKPVVYYQFDRDRFIGKKGSHLDLDNDLPGDIVYEMDDVLAMLEKYAANDFIMEPEYVRRANKFIKFRDQNSSERIYKVALHADSALAKKKKKISDSVIGNALFRRFRRSRYYFPVMKAAYKVMKTILPVDKRLILFESGVGKQYADSPRYIYEELIKRNSDYKKVWVYTGKMPVRDQMTKKIKRLSPSYYYYLARAGFWVNNQNFPTYLTKRKQTTYIQTWHGTPLKKMQFDIDEIQGRDETYLERVYKASQRWDYLLSPSPYATKAFRSAFRYDGEIIEGGYPRNDLFFREDRDELAAKVMKRLGIPEGKKVILYAPTFRDNQTSKNNKFVFDLNMDLEEMQNRLGDEYILLLRMHVVISNNLRIPVEYRDFVKNVSKYPDIQELYLISDILITDYSSVMFDFANTGRPILYYAYDLEDYRDNLRGFYMDFEAEAPGPFVKDTESIIESIVHLDDVKKTYQQKYAAFQDKYCGLEDGKAAKRIVDQFLDDH